MEVEVRSLRLVRTDPTGPSGGGGLLIGDERVCLLRRRLGGRVAGPCRPRGDVAAAVSGTPAELMGLGWLSPGAQIELQRAAHDRASGAHLAMRLSDGLREETWLLAGPAPAAARAAAILSGAAPATAPTAGGEVAAGGRGVRPALRRLLPLAVLAAVIAGVALLARGPGEDALERIREGLRPPEDRAPGMVLATARPHGVGDVVRAAASEQARAAGVVLEGPPRMAPRRAVVRMHGPAGRFALVVHPTPRDAAAARRAGEGRHGNLVLQGAGGRPRASVLRAL